MNTMLPSKAITEIELHDYAAHVQHRKPNVTRFYKYLQVEESDLEIFTVAVKCGRRGSVCKEVVRASVNEPHVYVRDLAFMPMAGYMVDWSWQGLGPDRKWSQRMKWFSSPYTRSSGLWKLQRTVINPEVLQQSERLRYCAWTPECGDILDYLKAYVAHPRIELLSKAGAGWLAGKVGFVSRLESDKGLMRFFHGNLEEIRRARYGVDAILKAYRLGMSLAEAQDRIGDRRAFYGMGLPSEVDVTRAMEYCRQQAIPIVWNYCIYLHNCQKLGLDLNDTKTAFPKQFKVRRTIVADQVAEIARRKNAEEKRRLDAAIAEVAARYARMEKQRSGYCVLLPRKSDDLKREGKRLHNCLGDGHYAAKVARGESVLAFIRRAEHPMTAFVTAEFSLQQRRVTQCYAAKNARPPDAVVRFVDRHFRAHVRGAA